MASVKKKAVEVELTEEQRTTARHTYYDSIIIEARRKHLIDIKQINDVYFNGENTFRESIDNSLEAQIFSSFFSKKLGESMREFNEIDRDYPIFIENWKSFSGSFKAEILNDISKFAISCGASKDLVKERIKNFELIKDEAPQLPARTAGKPSPYPGQRELAVCLLQFWLDAGKKIRIGRIRYDDGSLTPSPVVEFIKKYLTEIVPSFSLLDSKLPIDEQRLERAHGILTYLKEAKKLPNGEKRSAPRR
jgi:hypothetical protein